MPLSGYSSLCPLQVKTIEKNENQNESIGEEEAVAAIVEEERAVKEGVGEG